MAVLGGNGSESLLEGHEPEFSEHSTVAAAHETAGESKRTLDCLRYVSLNLPRLWTLRLCMLEAALAVVMETSICLSFLRPMSSGRLQVKVRESLDCLSLDRLCACPVFRRIHLGVLMWMHVHVILLRLGPHLLLLLRLLLLLHMRRDPTGFPVPRGSWETVSPAWSQLGVSSSTPCSCTHWPDVGGAVVLL